MGNFVFPFLAIYLTKTLGMDEKDAGLFIMLSTFAGILGMLVGGSLADHIGRKHIMVFSTVASALLLLPCAFLGKSSAIPWLLVFSTFFISMFHPASSAMVADLTAPESRSSAYSLLYLGINIGMAAGPLIAGFLFEKHITLLFLGDVATSLVSIMLIMVFIKDTKPTGTESGNLGREAAPNESPAEGNAFILLLRRPLVLVYTLAFTLMSFAYAQHSFSIPLLADKLFAADGPKVFGLLMTINCVVVILLTTLITSLSRRYNTILNTAASAVLYAIGFGILYFSNQYFMLIISTIIWSIGEILATTNFQVYISEHSPITHRARFNAITMFITRGGYAIGPAVMGSFIGYYGIRAVWPVIFLLALASACVLYINFLMEKVSKMKVRSFDI